MFLMNAGWIKDKAEHSAVGEEWWKTSGIYNGRYSSWQTTICSAEWTDDCLKQHQPQATDGAHWRSELFFGQIVIWML